MSHTVAGLMELVAEYGQLRWSEGVSGASYMDRMGEKQKREEAAEMSAEIQAYAAALAQPPQGWKLVPIEPTREMRDAGAHSVNLNYNAIPNEKIAQYAYKAMLEAAPEAPK